MGEGRQDLRIEMRGRKGERGRREDERYACFGMLALVLTIDGSWTQCMMRSIIFRKTRSGLLILLHVHVLV